MPKPFDRLALGEGGYTVEFSNRGGKRKNNPTIVNLERREVHCGIEGCGNTTKNQDSVCRSCKKKKEKLKHTVDWVGRIIPEDKTREECLTWAPAHSEITEVLVRWMKEVPEKRQSVMDAFINDLLDNIVGRIPDATTLQKDYESGSGDPQSVVNMAKEVVDRHFPRGMTDEVDWLYEGKYKELKKIPVRIVAILLAIAFASEESNRGDLYFWKNKNQEGRSKYASAFMSAAYYLLRRYGATETQAKMSVRH